MKTKIVWRIVDLRRAVMPRSAKPEEVCTRHYNLSAFTPMAYREVFVLLSGYMPVLEATTLEGQSVLDTFVKRCPNNSLHSLHIYPKSLVVQVTDAKYFPDVERAIVSSLTSTFCLPGEAVRLIPQAGRVLVTMS